MEARPRRMRQPVAALLAVAAALALSTVAGGVSVGQAAAADDAPAQMAAVANADRAAAGLAPLARSADMDAVAQAWAVHMGSNNDFRHNPDFADQVPDGWRGVAENIAAGQDTPASMQSSWMNSEGHRRNLLGDYTHIGVAFVEVAGSTYGTWGVQVFGKYPSDVQLTPSGVAAPAAPAAPAPEAAAPAPASPAASVEAAPVAAAPVAKPAPAAAVTVPLARSAALFLKDAGVAAGREAGGADATEPDSGAAAGDGRTARVTSTAASAASAALDPVPIALSTAAALAAIGAAAVLLLRRRRRHGRHVGR